MKKTVNYKSVTTVILSDKRGKDKLVMQRLRHYARKKDLTVVNALRNLILQGTTSPKTKEGTGN